MTESRVATVRRSVLWMLAAALAAASVLIGVAMFVARADAQEDGTDGDTPAEGSEAGHGSEAGEGSEAGHGSETAEGEECDGHHDKDSGHFPGGRRGLRADSERLAEIIGVEVDALREALKSGKSLADLADENGVDPQTLIDEIADSIEERVSALLEEGLIDSEKADEMLAGAEAKAEEIVNRERPADGDGGRHDGDRPGFGRHDGDRPGFGDLDGAVAETLT